MGGGDTVFTPEVRPPSRITCHLGYIPAQLSACMCVCVCVNDIVLTKAASCHCCVSDTLLFFCILIMPVLSASLICNITGGFRYGQEKTETL